ncbi:MAG: hypothetical protein U0795_10880 [Pirellulales bacterium]
MQALRPELNSAATNNDQLSPDLPKSLRAKMIALKSEEFAHRFSDTDWSYDPQMVEYHVSRSDRGGGYQIWHLPETGETFLSGVYW